MLKIISCPRIVYAIIMDCDMGITAGRVIVLCYTVWGYDRYMTYTKWEIPCTFTHSSG